MSSRGTRATLAALLLAGLASLGCTTGTRAGGAGPSVALAVRTTDGRPPSPEQVAAIHRSFQPQLASAGLRYADDLPTADFVVTLSFTPGVGAGSGGHITVSGIEPRARFGRSHGQPETSEVKELRQRLGEIDRWVERQARER